MAHKDKDKQLPPPDAQHNHTVVVRQVSGQDGNVFGHITVQVDGGKEVGFSPKTNMTTEGGPRKQIRSWNGRG